MTETITFYQRERTHIALKWPTSESDPDGLRAMVEFGVKEFKTGEWRGIRFEVYNATECAAVESLMSAHLDIPYGINVIFNMRGESESK